MIVVRVWRLGVGFHPDGFGLSWSRPVTSGSGGRVLCASLFFEILVSVRAQVAFEEKEWELDQLEKLKEEQEAEIDEDNEPLFYESTW